MANKYRQPYKTELTSHPFFLEMLERQVGFSKKMPPKVHDVYRFIEESDIFSAEEKFTATTICLFQEMHFKIDKVQHCSYMLDFYPLTLREAWASPLTRGEYIEHIMELYFMHSMGMLDRLLHLYNFLFGLKMDPRKHSVRKIIYALTDREAGLPLFAFDAMLKSIRVSRNAVVHEYRYNDAIIGDLIIRDIAIRHRRQVSRGKTDKEFDKVNARYDRLVGDLKRSILQNNATLTENYMEVFRILEKQYRARAVSLGLKGDQTD